MKLNDLPLPWKYRLWKMGICCLPVWLACTYHAHAQKWMLDSAAINRAFQSKMQLQQSQELSGTGGNQVMAAAATVPSSYQWYVSPTGNNANAGTQTAPFRTIQYAISRATTGQAIKVADGRYVECIDFIGKSIKVVGNPGNPEAVVIDGNDQTATVKMIRKETSATLLCGFTITGGNGSASDIYLNCGGGIHMYDNANPVLSDLIITGNYAPSGAAIGALHGASPVIQNTLVYNNTGDVLNYIIRFHNQANGKMYNVTVADNHSTQGAIGLSITSYVTIKNCIIWNPTGDYEVALRNSANYLGQMSSLTINYCDVRGGTSLMVTNNQGTITPSNILNVSPGFVDPSSGKYQLVANSSCIDQGDPASTWNDLNFPPSRGTVRNDLGAYGGAISAQPYQTPPVRMIQYVYDLSGNQTDRQNVIVMHTTGGTLSRASMSRNTYDDVLEDLTASYPTNTPESFDEVLPGFNIVIYPNPTQGMLRVDINGNSVPPNAVMYLYNATGTLLRQWTPISASNPMDISAYPAGTYLMRIVLDKDNVSTWKIIKQ